MTSVNDVRARISLGNEKIQEGIAAVEQAIGLFKAAQGIHSQALAASSQADADDAVRLLEAVIDDLRQGQQQASCVVSAAEGAAARL
jgi:hypothetical protein